MPAAASLFSLLGIAPSSTDAEVRSAFRKKFAELHPDRNPGFKDAATKASAQLSAEFAAYTADPEGYRAAYHAPEPEPSAPSDAAGPADVEEAIELVGSLVELFVPRDRLDAARRAHASGARVARRYAARPGRG